MQALKKLAAQLPNRWQAEVKRIHYGRQISKETFLTTEPEYKILDEFTKEEIETIHPVLSPVMIQCLVEELELVGYLEVKDGKVTVTDKGKKKAETFKAGLSKEEIEALRI